MTNALKNPIILPTIILSLAFVVSFSVIARAITADDVAYPVAELGGCKNEKECRNYCDQPDNFAACFDFAKKNNLLEGPLSERSSEELDEFGQILKSGGGPGGCKSQTSCETYCNDANHIDACVAFAEEYGFMSDEELKEAKQVRSALASGAKLPGGCKNKDACEQYCQNETHFDECFAFAEAAGFLSDDEREMIKKTGGRGPGGCRGKEACEQFCEDNNNFEVCIAFAEEHGFMSKEDVERAKKTGGRGPGGCKGQECMTYCDDPGHEEECIRFATEHDILSDEDKERINEGRDRFREEIDRMPPEVKSCLESAIGVETVNQIASGSFTPSRSLGEKMQSCFQNVLREEMRSQSGEHGEFPEGDFSGPGGCANEDECRNYCEQNPQECSKFSPDNNSNQDRRMPTGDNFERPNVSPEEYCKEHPDQCQRMTAPNMPSSGELNLPPEEFQKEYQEQFKEQFEQQYQQQYQQQFEEEQHRQEEMQYQQMAPPSTNIEPVPLGSFLLGILSFLLPI